MDTADTLPITFEPGSGRYDREARIFRFTAADHSGRVACAISQTAFERLAGIKVDEAHARDIFADWEQVVFHEAAQQYGSKQHQPGTIALGM